MKTARLADMVKGWFIGDFSPTLHRTRAVEVAVKNYCAGANEAAHYHKVAIEFTVIMSGEVEMNGRRYAAGDIIVIEPGDITDFRAVTDTVTTVVKIPGAPDDKFLP
jgi:quercetin dioxygenase-like cupin family protein